MSAERAESEHVHDYQWHPLSGDFGVCSQCGAEASPEDAPHPHDAEQIERLLKGLPLK